MLASTSATSVVTFTDMSCSCTRTTSNHRGSTYILGVSATQGLHAMGRGDERDLGTCLCLQGPTRLHAGDVSSCATQSFHFLSLLCISRGSVVHSHAAGVRLPCYLTRMHQLLTIQCTVLYTYRCLNKMISPRKMSFRLSTTVQRPLLVARDPAPCPLPHSLLSRPRRAVPCFAVTSYATYFFAVGLSLFYSEVTTSPDIMNVCILTFNLSTIYVSGHLLPRGALHNT